MNRLGINFYVDIDFLNIRAPGWLPARRRSPAAVDGAKTRTLGFVSVFRLTRSENSAMSALPRAGLPLGDIRTLPTRWSHRRRGIV